MTSLANQRPTPSPFVNRPGPYRLPIGLSTCLHHSITRTRIHTHTWEKAEHARPRAHGGERATTTSAVKYPCGRLQAGLMELIKMCSINRTAGPPLTIRLACSPSYRLYLSTVHPPAPPPCPLVADPRTSGAQSNICV